MNVQLQIFSFEDEESKAFNQIRTIDIDGKVYFCGVDVAKALGYSNPNDAIIRHCKSTGIVNHEVGVETGKKGDGTPSIQLLNLKFISEGNIYRLVSRSSLKEAERFSDWIFDEVIPSIRQKGFYGKIDRSEIPNFVLRYKDNLHNIPAGYFSVISEMFVRLYSEFEKMGYAIPDKSFYGKQMMPDISVGKDFSTYLKKKNSPYAKLYKTYKHIFPDGRPPVDARMYPIEALPDFYKFINNVWLKEKAYNYFKERDPLALDYLPKILEAHKEAEMIYGVNEITEEEKKDDTPFNNSIRKALGYNPREEGGDV